MTTVVALLLLASHQRGIGASVPASPLPPGNHTIAVNHDSREGSALVHIPPRANKQSPVPVVLNFHGGGGHGANQQQFSLLDRVAERETFVTAYPNGTGRLQSRLLTWNAGTCCAYAVLNNVDDVGFVLALLKRLAQVIPMDRRRVYATDMSNDAMMAYRLASQAPGVFAAIAPVAGAMVVPMIRSVRPVPVMHFHSIDDPRALYGGGLGPPFPLTQSRVLHPDIDPMISQWVEHNGCAKEAKITTRMSDRDGRGHTAVRQEFGSCRSGADVVLWKLSGAGHVWPGGKQKTMERIFLGPSTDIIDANSEMWNFFLRYRL